MALPSRTTICFCVVALLAALPKAFTVSGHRPWTDCSPCDCIITFESKVLSNHRVKLADCHGRGLVDVPATVPSDADELDLRDNDLGKTLLTNHEILWRFNSTKAINLSRNNLTTLPVEFFRNITKLQHLELSGNEFDTLPARVFSWNPLLVTATGLHVETAPDALFRGLKKLRTLGITTTQEHIPSDLLDDVKLESIELHALGADSLPPDMLHGSKTSLLDVTVTGNKLTSISENLLKDTDIRSARLHLPEVRILPSGFFQHFSGSVSHLSEIAVSGVSTLPPDLLQTLANLEVLCLNGVSEIPSNMFEGLLRLDILDLSGNNLTQTDAHWFSDIGSGLKSLNLSGNHLTSVTKDNLGALESLEELDLSKNSITQVQEESLQSFRYSLRELNLSRNRICSLPNGVFSTLWHLRILRMDHNCLTGLSNKLFADLLGLKELYLQNNNLHELPQGLLNPLSMLETLNISSTQLQVLPRDWLAGMEFLRVLDVSNNTIGHIPVQLLPPGPGLKEVYLGANPLHCDCGIVLFTVMYRLQLTDRMTGICTLPEKLAGKLITDLNLIEVCGNISLEQHLSRDMNEDWEVKPASPDNIGLVSEDSVSPLPSDTTDKHSSDTELGSTNKLDKGSDAGLLSLLGKIYQHLFYRGHTGGTKGASVSEAVEETSISTPSILFTIFMLLVVLCIVGAVYKIHKWRGYRGSYVVNRV